MTLREYRRKRDFRHTPEPGPKRAKVKGWTYVIQKHAASHLHYDLRLELDGVLKSWAVPKGPSLDPKIRRLAIHVEDHPVEYGEFEGLIPTGEYGGGTVMLWDRGTWEPVGDPHDGYRDGKLKFRLHGEKLQGGWMLVRRSRSTSEKNNEWFLFKERDEAARVSEKSDVVEEMPLSVASGRDLDEIQADQDEKNVWRSNRSNGRSSTKSKRRVAKKVASRKRVKIPPELTGAKRAGLPRRIEAKLAKLAKEVPPGNNWLHEIKFDGYRMFCRIDAGRIEFVSRNHKNWTHRLKHLVDAASKLPLKQTILDGEVVAMNEDGTTDFQTLQNAFSEGRAKDLVYYAFDLLYLDGIDLRNVALIERKKLLKKLLPTTQQGILRYSEHFAGNGPQFYKQATKLGLEGIICKLRDGLYTAGRSHDWLKVKSSHREEFVIGGFTDPGGRGGFGALLLGYHDKSHQLVYAGKVGTGFSDAFLKKFRARLDGIVQKKSPFANLRRATGEVKGGHWVKPQLVAQVAFTEWTGGGQLRHPSFLGLRDDKPASKVVREEALHPSESSKVSQQTGGRMKAIPKQETPVIRSSKSGESAGALAGVRLTHPDKIFFSDEGITKLELAQFYLDIAHWILPHVANRPLSLVRCPDGADGECFFQKHPGLGTPKTFRLVPIKEKNQTRNYLVVDKAEDLVTLAQIGALEIHVWGSQVDQLEKPDRMIFDLDPDPAVPWSRVVESAQQVRVFLKEIGLESFVKTTGGKGLHIVVPIQRRHAWDEVKAFSKVVAEIIERADPHRYTTNMSKAARSGKIYIDYLRNGRTATAIAAYSTRARPRATVSVPLSWDELTPDIHSDAFTIRNLPNRLNSLEQDPWAKIASTRQSLTKAVKKRLGISAE